MLLSRGGGVWESSHQRNECSSAKRAAGGSLPLSTRKPPSEPHEAEGGWHRPWPTARRRSKAEAPRTLHLRSLYTQQH
ncbi:hypothetical protein BHM03_00008134 [Ensete ventricosum]|nr:hypothetical protein BHM03_00008134 [Ensete ventricosum]